MIAAYFLIVLYTNGNGTALTSVPMEIQELCQMAAQQVKADLERTLTTARATCVRAAQ